MDERSNDLLAICAFACDLRFFNDLRDLNDLQCVHILLAFEEPLKSLKFEVLSWNLFKNRIYRLDLGSRSREKRSNMTIGRCTNIVRLALCGGGGPYAEDEIEDKKASGKADEIEDETQDQKRRNIEWPLELSGKLLSERF